MEYQINITDNKVSLEGILRLLSPYDYEEPFKPIQERISNTTDVFIIDISNLIYLNSSGVTAFAKLIILAKEKKKKLTIVGTLNTPWQKSSMSCLDKLYDGVTMDWK